MPICYCTYFGCSGKIVDDKTRKRHERFDVSETYHNHSDVRRHFGFARYLWLMLFQRNTNGVSVALQLQEDLEPEPRTEPKTPMPTPQNQTSITLIPESVTEMLQSLVELQQKAALQSSALHNLKRRALTSSPPNKALLEEIETHHIGMEVTLATLIAFGCGGSSVASRGKEELKTKLRIDIEEIKHLRDVLTNASTSGLPVTRKVISIDKPGESSIVKIPTPH